MTQKAIVTLCTINLVIQLQIDLIQMQD